MEEDFTLIKQLLPKLNSPSVKQAEAELNSICKSETALQYMLTLLNDPSLADPVKQLAATQLNNMFVRFAQNYCDNFTQRYLITLISDLRITYEVKKMMVKSLMHRMLQTQSFIKALLDLTHSTLASISQFFNQSGQECKQFSQNDRSTYNEQNGEDMLYISSKEGLINGSYTVIIIGQAIFSLISAGRENDQIEQSKESLISNKVVIRQVKYLRDALTFTKCCGKLHEYIFNPQNILNHPYLFEKLISLYDMLHQETVQDELKQQCYKQIANWPHLKNNLANIYFIQTNSEYETLTNSKAHLAVFEELKGLTSSLHWRVIKYLSENKQIAKVHQLLDDFIRPIKQALTNYNQKVTFQVQYVNTVMINFVLMLQEYYKLQEKIGTASMIDDFQMIFLPLVSKVIVYHRVEIFMCTPNEMYIKLCEILEKTSEKEDILELLTAIINFFIDLSEDFYLYLFQTFRHGLEKQLQCQNIDDWQPPQYLLEKKPLDLTVIFYLMSFIPYTNELAPGIFSYLKQLITPQFVKKLSYMQLAMFYFFLQNIWFQLYGDDFKTGTFLLTHIFDPEINHASKYFLYEFIYKISDYVIDTDYIIEYVKNLPHLYEYSNKWKNVFKWLTYLQDFEERFTIELVRIVKYHLHEEIELYLESKSQNRQINYREVKMYLEILIRIARNKVYIKEKVELQLMLLQEYKNINNINHPVIEDSLNQLLATLFPYFFKFQQTFGEILANLLQRSNHNPSSSFYLLLAEYIYQIKDKQMLVLIIQFLCQMTKKVFYIIDETEQNKDSILLEVANCMILFQNLMLRHWNVLGQGVGKHIVDTVYQIKRYLADNMKDIFQLRPNEYYWTAYARTIIIPLIFYQQAQKQPEGYFHYFLETGRYIFLDYDAKLMIEMLISLNLKAPAQERAIILQIIKNLLGSIYYEYNLSEDKTKRLFRYKKLFFLPSRMTSVIDLSKTVFREIKKFMTYYSLPNWANMRNYTVDLPPNFEVQFREKFKACGMIDRQQQLLKSKSLSEYILMIDQDKVVCLKRRREEERFTLKASDEELSRGFVKRRTMHESFTKRVKRDFQSERNQNSNNIYPNENRYVAHKEIVNVNSENVSEPYQQYEDLSEIQQGLNNYQIQSDNDQPAQEIDENNDQEELQDLNTSKCQSPDN